eukprot:513059-Rhodomonas_salina.1
MLRVSLRGCKSKCGQNDALRWRPLTTRGQAESRGPEPSTRIFHLHPKPTGQRLKARTGLLRLTCTDLFVLSPRDSTLASAARKSLDEMSRDTSPRI